MKFRIKQLKKFKFVYTYNHKKIKMYFNHEICRLITFLIVLTSIAKIVNSIKTLIDFISIKKILYQL